MHYAYLIGTGVLGLLWLVPFLMRKDLRPAMLWSAKFYIIILTIGFAVLWAAHISPAYRINPGYWTPPSLFDLNNITDGYGIEDAIFMFFMAGIAASAYELLTKRRITAKPDERLKKRHALSVGLLAAVIVCAALRLNEIYLLILFHFFGGLVMVYYRRDLLKQAVCSGLVLMVVYGVFFVLFDLVFANFIGTHYHLQHTSGLMPLGIPLEEYLYGLAFGFMWGPLYEYKHQLRETS